jgi:hypothetical protein
MRFLIRDRDAKLCRGFDDMFRAEGAEVLVTAVPVLNANALRGTVAAEHSRRMPWLLILGRGHWSRSSGSTSSTSTSSVHTDCLGWNRPALPPVGPWSERLDEPGYADATSLASGSRTPTSCLNAFTYPMGSSPMPAGAASSRRQRCAAGGLWD